jgi:hypothetical protein
VSDDRREATDVTLRQLGLTAYFSGVGTAVVGLLASGSMLRTLACNAAALLMLGGVVVLLLTLRGERIGRPSGPVAFLALAGLALHVYETTVVVPVGFSPGLLAWGLTPYAVSLAVSALPIVRREALAGAAVALAFDLVLHLQVFRGPWDFGSAFVLLFRPLVSAAAIVPTVMLVAHWMRVRNARS